MRVLLTVFALLAALPAGAELQIAVTADPPLPVPNLMENAEFERGDDSAPAGWAVNTSISRAGAFERLAEGGRNGAYLRVESFTSTTNAYASRAAPVEPDTLYRAGAWVRMRGGAMVMWLHAWVDGKRFAERAYLHSQGLSPLVPDFVRLEWTDSPDPDEWHWVGREFNTWPDQEDLSMHLGAYFERSSMDIDGAFLGLARTTLTVSVTGGGIERVRVENEAGEEVWSSGELAGGTTTMRQDLPDLPTDSRYRVIATQPDGTEVAAWYPEEQ
ncbi:MAG: hypothetical protein GF393_05335 [Armatimonadia bacterium]|nr:hypothetical protein [Armatimonadia bacterium]